MPLTVLQYKPGNKPENAQAKGLISTAVHTNPTRIGAVGMYAFKAVNNTQQETVLTTSGAGPCQIIVVHGGPGRGALGHFAGTNDPDKIIAGVVKMVAIVGHPIDTIVFAAGYGVEDDPKAQAAYEKAIYDGTVKRFGGARVLYPPQGDDPFGTALYMPLREELALVSDAKSLGVPNFGSQGTHGGISVHSYEA